jgi:hypothetical protein
MQIDYELKELTVELTVNVDENGMADGFHIDKDKLLLQIHNAVDEDELQELVNEALRVEADCGHIDDAYDRVKDE